MRERKARWTSATVTVTRLGVLERLGVEPNPDRRRRLFDALEPVWQTIDADGGVASPYQRLLPLSADRWARDGRRWTANAAALGLTGAEVEAQPDRDPGNVARRRRRRDARVEPWDWWYEAGAASRALRAALPLDRIRELSDAYHASLGADPARAGRRLRRVPADRAAACAGRVHRFRRSPARPGRRPAQAGARPWVMGTYTTGGLGELTELMHESGHAIHLAAIDTRPAFADWPDSDAFTEALAELTALDTAEPAWQGHWLGVSVPEAASLRGRYADVMLDMCWALFEIRLHADPQQDPNDVWTELTSSYLGIEPHPGAVLVGDARAARPGARLHGQLRARPRSSPPTCAPRSAPRGATGRPAILAGTSGSRRASTAGDWNASGRDVLVDFLGRDPDRRRARLPKSAGAARAEVAGDVDRANRSTPGAEASY